MPQSETVDLEPGDILEQALIGPPIAGLVDLLLGTRHDEHTPVLR